VLTVGSLFAGIGGFDLGLERAGMRSVWQCEIDPYCQRVLAKPDVLRVPDVRDIRTGTVPPVDVLCGGFPCQDLSVAGKGAGIDGARSGLWGEYARLIGELRPSYLLVENVTDLLAGAGKRWDRAPIGRVLGDLATLGYDAEWDCIPASAFGAPHQRDRVWIVAYPQRDELREQPGRRDGQGGTGSTFAPIDGSPRSMANADEFGRIEGLQQCAGRGERQGPGDAERRIARHAGQRAGSVPWPAEPDVGRVADGVPHRVDRLRALGNSLVPQIAEWIGRRIVEWERVNA
jgi:DNA (cytosine-5)-methyltransferase 1